MRAVYWVATYILHEQIKPACQKLINQNYHLYLDMSCYRKAPLQIVSIWNIVLLAVQNYTQSLFLARQHGANICGVTEHDHKLSWMQISPQMFIVIFCGLETFTLGCFYIPAISKFHCYPPKHRLLSYSLQCDWCDRLCQNRTPRIARIRPCPIWTRYRSTNGWSGKQNRLKYYALSIWSWDTKRPHLACWIDRRSMILLIVVCLETWSLLYSLLDAHVDLYS